jgi:hypothetical protein
MPNSPSSENSSNHHFPPHLNNGDLYGESRHTDESYTADVIEESSFSATGHNVGVVAVGSGGAIFPGSSVFTPGTPRSAREHATHSSYMGTGEVRNEAAQSSRRMNLHHQAIESRMPQTCSKMKPCSFWALPHVSLARTSVNTCSTLQAPQDIHSSFFDKLFVKKCMPVSFI